jgi:Domain of unknown function (DUF6930)
VFKRELRASCNGTALDYSRISDVIAEACDAEASGREDIIIATAVLNAIYTAQCLPREVRVNQHQFRMFLEPLASELGLAVRTLKRLPALQRAKEELLAMMWDPGPFRS